MKLKTLKDALDNLPDTAVLVDVRSLKNELENNIPYVNLVIDEDGEILNFCIYEDDNDCKS